MTHPHRPSLTRDEVLWMLTGLLVGLAIWLATDNLAAAIGVGTALGIMFGAQERARRTQGQGSAHPEAS